MERPIDILMNRAFPPDDSKDMASLPPVLLELYEQFKKGKKRKEAPDDCVQIQSQSKLAPAVRAEIYDPAKYKPFSFEQFANTIAVRRLKMLKDTPMDAYFSGNVDADKIMLDQRFMRTMHHNISNACRLYLAYKDIPYMSIENMVSVCCLLMYAMGRYVRLLRRHSNLLSALLCVPEPILNKYKISFTVGMEQNRFTFLYEYKQLKGQFPKITYPKLTTLPKFLWDSQVNAVSKLTHMMNMCKSRYLASPFGDTYMIQNITDRHAIIQQPNLAFPHPNEADDEMKKRTGIAQRACLIHMPTGNGKTHTALAYALQNPDHKSLVIVDGQNRGLHQQWGTHFEDKFKRPYAKIKSGRGWNKQETFVVLMDGTTPTVTRYADMCKREGFPAVTVVYYRVFKKGFLDLIPSDSYDHILLDEAHKEAQGRVLQKYVLKMSTRSVVLVSATPWQRKSRISWYFHQIWGLGDWRYGNLFCFIALLVGANFSANSSQQSSQKVEHEVIRIPMTDDQRKLVGQVSHLILSRFDILKFQVRPVFKIMQRMYRGGTISPYILECIQVLISKIEAGLNYKAESDKKPVQQSSKPPKKIFSDLEDGCPFCMEEKFADPVSTPCGHVFCRECITPWVSSRHTCPACRKTCNSLHPLVEEKEEEEEEEEEDEKKKVDVKDLKQLYSKRSDAIKWNAKADRIIAELNIWAADNEGTDNQLILYSNSLVDTSRITSTLDDLDIPFSNAMDTKKTSEAIAAFQRGDARVIILGRNEREAIDFKNAHTMWVIDVHQDNDVMHQILGRIKRAERKHLTVHIKYFVMEGGYDDIILKVHRTSGMTFRVTQEGIVNLCMQTLFNGGPYKAIQDQLYARTTRFNQRWWYVGNTWCTNEHMPRYHKRFEHGSTELQS